MHNHFDCKIRRVYSSEHWLKWILDISDKELRDLIHLFPKHSDS